MTDIEKKSLSESLRDQVNLFIDHLEEYNKKRKFKHEERDYAFLRDFFINFFEDRNRRAVEVESKEYHDIIEFANQQFPATTLWNLCMDGRVLAVLLNGASAKVGSSIRVPGGILKEFVWDEEGKLHLIEDSNFAFIMKRALKRFKTDRIFEVYDSHIACAARKAEELSTGRDPKDFGLFADVVFKKQMSEATKAFIAKTCERTIHVTPIQTSFNPSTGFIYMGLETEAALAYAKKMGTGFSSDVIDKLVEEKMIISAEKLAKDITLRKLFEAHAFELDWKFKYVESATHFWQHISEMKNDELPVIEKMLIRIYPELSKQGENEKQELQERAMLLLTNSYSGFLNNKYYKEGKEASENSFQYPYGVHREEGVKLSEGGYPPYAISMFVVFSLDRKNLPANTELASALVRSNRREGRITDHSGNFTDPQEFAEAPVPVVVQEIVREELDADEWSKLIHLDWSDLPHDWDTMHDTDFYNYLQKKSNMSISAAGAINKLRERTAILYDPDQPTAAHLVAHYKVALPVIVGNNRMNYFIVPFVKLGYALPHSQ